MVGIMHALFLNFIKKNWGDEALRELKEEAGLPSDQGYRLDTFYSEEQWRSLVRAAARITDMQRDVVEYAFARYAGEDLANRFPGFFRGAECARDMIRRQPAIHNFIAASVSDPASQKAITDKFRLEERANETVTHYTSPNQECILYLGLAQWVADYFNEQIDFEETKCQKRGDPECEIHIRYLGKKAS